MYSATDDITVMVSEKAVTITQYRFCLFVDEILKNFWGGGIAPPQIPPHWEGDTRSQTYPLDVFSISSPTQKSWLHP